MIVSRVEHLESPAQRTLQLTSELVTELRRWAARNEIAITLRHRVYDSRLPRALHLALAFLVLLEGGFNVMHGLMAERSIQLIAFGTAEAVGAVLFVVSRTLAAGACILVCAFLVAAGAHVLERELPIEHLVYAVAVLVVLAHHANSDRSRPPAA